MKNKKKFKKLQSLLGLSLAGVMLLSACGATESSGKDTSSQTASSQTASSQTASSSEDVSTESEDPVKLTVWIAQREGLNYDEFAIVDTVEEKCNVELEFEYYSTADGDATMLNLLYESGDYPDILMGFSFTPEQIIAGANAGVLLPLNDYIKDGTSYQTALDENPGWYDYVTAPDGNIYTFFISMTDVHTVALNRLWYRTEWLEKLGWDTPPETTEEFKEFLIQIRDEDVNGNGDPDDEIPLMGSLGSSYGYCTGDPIGFLMSSFEYYWNEYYYITEDNELYFSAITDGWRNGLAYMADLYAEGLIAPETYVQDRASLKGYVSRFDQEALVGVTADWYFGHFSDLSVTPYDTYTALAPLMGDYQQAPARDGIYGFILDSAISTQCENPEKAFEVLDWFLSDESAWYQFYGEEGVTYEWQDVENLMGTSPAVVSIPSEERAEPDKQYNLGHNYTPLYEKTEHRYSIVSEQNHDWYLVENSKVYEPYYKESGVPVIHWADEAVTMEMNEYRTLINDCIRTADTEFVMGIRDINNDGDWQAYLDELNAMGLEQYIELLKQYYDAK